MTTRRRLIVLTYHFPPDPAIGGSRWAGLGKYLAARGWEVHVITSSPQGTRPQVPGVIVHHCARARILNDVYNDWVTRRRRPTEGSTGNGSADQATRVEAIDSHTAASHENESLAERVRRTVGTAIAFPDYARGWTLRAAAMARTIQRQMPVDAIVSSGPPHSAHIAGVLASLGRRTPLMVDLRDPWSPVHDAAGTCMLIDSPSMRTALDRMERFTFGQARHVIANSSELAEMLANAYPTLSVLVVPNGIDTDRLPSPEPKFSNLTISYIGSLYLGRDLTPVVRALTEFVDRHPASRPTTSLIVAGYMSPSHEAMFWSAVDAAELRDVVDARATMPGDEALRVVNRSHLAIVLAQGQRSQIPAKLYECVAMGVPTLVIGERDTATWREAERVGAMIVEPDDINGIRRIIDRTADDAPRPTQAPVAVGYNEIAAEMDRILRACSRHI